MKEKQFRLAWLAANEETKQVLLDSLANCETWRDKFHVMIFLTSEYMRSENLKEKQMTETLFLKTHITMEGAHFFCLDLNHSIHSDTLNNTDLLREYYLLALLGSISQHHSAENDRTLLMRDLVKKITGQNSDTLLFNPDLIFNLTNAELEKYYISVLLNYKSKGFNVDYLAAILNYQTDDLIIRVKQYKLFLFYLGLNSRMHQVYYDKRIQMYREIRKQKGF